MECDAKRLAGRSVAVSLVSSCAGHFAKALERRQILLLPEVDILDENVKVQLFDVL
jgi:hypothetical protein